MSEQNTKPREPPQDSKVRHRVADGVPQDAAPKKGPTAFELVGGEEVTRQIATRFYDLMEENEPELAKLHAQDAHGRVSPEARERFTLFFIEWLGGPALYSPTNGPPRLRLRHARVRVDTAMRDAWMRCMEGALSEVNLAPGIRSFLEMRLAEVAEHMRNVEG